MVLQKRLEYGFHGCQFPPTPRAARSARRRGSFKRRRHEDSQVCAFDLLAILAENLLLEKEPTHSSDNSSANNDKYEVINKNVKQESQDEATQLKVEAHDLESPSQIFLNSNIVSQVHDQNLSPKESVYSQADLNLCLASAITSELERRPDAVTLVSGSIKKESGTYTCKVVAGPSGCQVASEHDLGAEIKGKIKEEHPKSKKVPDSVVANICRLGDPVVGNRKPPTSFCSDTDPKVLSYGEHVPCDSCPPKGDDADMVSRDDDENSSGYTFPRTTKKYFKPAPRIGDWRIRKILAPRFWKAAPKLKDASPCDTNGLKLAFHNRNNYYKIQRSEKIYPFKKRKYHFQCSSPSNSDGAMCSDLVSDTHHRTGDGGLSGCLQKMQGGTGASSSITAENSSFQPRDSHVKLRIKSFRVPELFIDIPESATIGSLKRTVMESVTAVLRGGFRIGVILQGKKVRDDNKTLLQTGLSHNNQFDGVGFSLEPNPSQNAHSLCNGGLPFLPSSDTPQPLNRCPPSSSVVHQGTLVTPPESHVNYLGNIVESDHDSAPSSVDMLIDKPTTNSKALVAVPAMNVEALAVVPVQRKLKQSEIVQRRIRRPFSVAEVEALVKAVEKLGTGRWRDVKLRAFDNAKHRTYVDLKDKWKTLVHTAKISPQQRRGEPVPQELLDRVLTAHAYWSQQQSKQLHVKHQQPETCLLL